MENITRERLVEMGNEWLKMQFVTREEHFRQLFSELSAYDYFTLLSLQNRMGFGQNRLYLQEICEELDLTIGQVSKLVQRLQERGYVYWTHHDSDRPGTYITLSESGREAMARQRERISVFFERTITEYGTERFMQLIELRRDFNETMEHVLAM